MPVIPTMTFTSEICIVLAYVSHSSNCTFEWSWFPRVDHGRLVNAHNNDILFPAAMIMWDIRTIAQCCLIMVRFRRGDYRLLSNIQICVYTNIYAIVATTMVNVWSMYGQCMVNVWSIYGQCMVVYIWLNTRHFMAVKSPSDLKHATRWVSSEPPEEHPVSLLVVGTPQVSNRGPPCSTKELSAGLLAVADLCGI